MPSPARPRCGADRSRELPADGPQDLGELSGWLRRHGGPQARHGHLGDQWPRMGGPEQAPRRAGARSRHFPRTGRTRQRPTRKGFKNSDPTNRDYEDDITFSVAIENTGQKNIRAFDGTLTFTDLLDNEIHSSLLAINEPVGVGATLVWNGWLKYNQFIDAHQRLRSALFENLKIKFIPRKLLFADGSMEQLNR
jgi:uncharacterized repeat protein (TIGR01451 family)